MSPSRTSLAPCIMYRTTNWSRMYVERVCVMLACSQLVQLTKMDYGIPLLDGAPLQLPYAFHSEYVDLAFSSCTLVDAC